MINPMQQFWSLLSRAQNGIVLGNPAFVLKCFDVFRRPWFALNSAIDETPESRVDDQGLMTND